MPVKKIKVSQLKAATTLVGLWTLGVDATNKSVKVSLEFIKQAYDDVVSATKKALDAATSADNSRKEIEKDESTRQSNETARVDAEKNRSAAESSRVIAEEGRVATEMNRVAEFATIKKNAETATGNANTQANRAKEQADNPPRMGENGNWWQWDDTLKKYVDTGVLAKGGVIYPTFSIEEEDMVLYMSFEDEVSPQLIKFDETTGELFLNVG